MSGETPTGESPIGESPIGESPIGETPTDTFYKLPGDLPEAKIAAATPDLVEPGATTASPEWIQWVFAFIALLVIMYMMGRSRASGFEPVRALDCGAYLQSGYSPVSYGLDDVDLTMEGVRACVALENADSEYPDPQPTVRDGTVAHPPSIADKVRAGLGAGSPGVAEYMRDGANPETGIGRVAWFRAMADPVVGAAARHRPVDPAYQLTPGTQGTLVPISAVSDRPMSLRRDNLLAGYAEAKNGANFGIGGLYSAEYVTDGPFGNALASHSRWNHEKVNGF